MPADPKQRRLYAMRCAELARNAKSPEHNALLAGANKVDPEELKARLDERDKRLANDHRDLTARLLGDPVRS